MKLFSLGFSDYKQIIDENRYYIDKTLFIDDLINYGGAVTLIPRPRRFGKTLNMSMLKYFFEKTEKSNSYLFENKKIWNVGSARALQGKFPLIFITFKDVRGQTWNDIYDKLIHLIADEYRRHSYLIIGNHLDQDEQTIFAKITSLTASESEYQMSLLYLSRFLERYHKEKTIILIDEYDLPLHEGLLYDFYDKIITFIRIFLGGGLKDNPNLKLSVITGILHTAKEGIFSGLNNPSVFTLVKQRFSDKFGFTDEEIDQLLKDYNLEHVKKDFKSWYNGYLIGETKVYNPWSTLSCVAERGEFLPYWGNTSGNALIGKIIASSSPHIKDGCAELLKGNVLSKIQLDDKMVLPTLESNPNTIWSMLLFSGYLTADSYKIQEGEYYADLILPNKELVLIFKRLISQLFEKSLDNSELISLKEALQNGNGELFSVLLSKFVAQSMSWHDISENEPEKSYHLFVLGLLVVLSESYVVRSNRESGYGRYDISLIPHDHSRPGFVIEFKKKENNETMEECAERALDQIHQKKYAVELNSIGIEQIIFFGIAFHKKELLLKVNRKGK